MRIAGDAEGDGHRAVDRRHRERRHQRGDELGGDPVGVAGAQERAEQDGERLVVDRGNDVAGAHAGSQSHRDLAAQRLEVGALGALAARPEPFDAKAEHRHRRRLALAQRQQLAEMLDQLLAMRQAGAGVGRMVAAAQLAPAPALDGEPDPAPADRAGQLVATDDVVGAASQPSARVLGIGLDDDDDERGPLGDRGDLGRRRRREVAVDEDGVDAGVTGEPLDRRRPAGGLVDGEAGSTRGRGHGENADGRSAHEIRRRKRGMNDSRKRHVGDHGAGRPRSRNVTAPSSAQANIGAHGARRQPVIPPGDDEAPGTVQTSTAGAAPVPGHEDHRPWP